MALLQPNTTKSTCAHLFVANDSTMKMHGSIRLQGKYVFVVYFPTVLFEHIQSNKDIYSA